MKKYLPFQAILIAIVQWVSNCPISAQSEWFSPQQWESLVQDSQKNLIIRDTVLYLPLTIRFPASMISFIHRKKASKEHPTVGRSGFIQGVH